MKDNEKQITKSCKNCVHNVVCDKKLDLKYFFDNHDCEHYQPKLPEDSVVLSKTDYSMSLLVASENGRKSAYKEIAECDKDRVVLSREEYENIYEQAEQNVLANIADGGTSCHWCIEQHEKKERQKTAEKFARDIFKHITTPEVWEKLRQLWLSKGGNFKANEHIYDLLIEPVATKFNVEIKE